MIAVTGASGQLGRLVVTGLLDAGVPASEVVAVVRTPEKVADLAARGVQVRPADYADPAPLETALDGVDRLYLVSGSEVGQRVTQHANVVAAAQAAGVGLLVYTSAPKADISTLVLAPEHKATEELIAATGMPALVLRHNWYLENYDQQIAQAAATGTLIGSAGEGRAWAATRADYAAGAVAVLTADDPEPGVYELGGSASFTLAELAAEVGRQAGRDVTYTDLPTAEHVQALTGVGLDEATAGFVAAIDAGVAAGELDTGDQTLAEWIGRPTTTLSAHVRDVLGG
jgi:NAD(P)H dehydrogenase (quinone)